MKTLLSCRLGFWLLLGFVSITTVVYWPGLSSGWLFDDYPNIVENHGVQLKSIDISSLTRAALSSPSSSFKRPLASLTFAANYLASGLNPYGWKLFNLLVHLLNGVLVFVLARQLLLITTTQKSELTGAENYASLTAAIVAGGWLLLPINITGVLYVVQRMESMANLFVLLGLIGYVAGRCRMRRSAGSGRTGLLQSTASIVLATSIGLLAKETAVMLPLYAVLIEWIVFGFAADPSSGRRWDWRLIALFTLVLVLPMIAGLSWLLPGVLNPQAWAVRDFTLRTRLLSEARIVVDYIRWTLLPEPRELSFYHDDFPISTGLLRPWTTLASILLLATIAASVVALRKRRPLVALGLALFLGCHLLTATILPLELIFEHRNYFASFGLLLALIPLILPASGTQPGTQEIPLRLARQVLLGGLLLLWTGETAMTTAAWDSPINMAESLAERAPNSPRAQYELGRMYIILSSYDPASPYTRMAYAPLERAATLPNSSILPEQALIFMNARMHLPIKDAWWNSMIAKLKAHKPGVQDESSLGALTQCVRDHLCILSHHRLQEAFFAALSHPKPSARLLATYSDYAWNVLHDRALGLRVAEAAAQADPDEPAYLITTVRMLAVMGRRADAEQAMRQLESLNIGGRLNKNLVDLHALLRQ